MPETVLKLKRTELSQDNYKIATVVLEKGEPFYNISENKLYVGDGSKTLYELQYIGGNTVLPQTGVPTGESITGISIDGVPYQIANGGQGDTIYLESSTVQGKNIVKSIKKNQDATLYSPVPIIQNNQFTGIKIDTQQYNVLSTSTFNDGITIGTSGEIYKYYTINGQTVQKTVQAVSASTSSVSGAPTANSITIGTTVYNLPQGGGQGSTVTPIFQPVQNATPIYGVQIDNSNYQFSIDCGTLEE